MTTQPLRSRENPNSLNAMHLLGGAVVGALGGTAVWVSINLVVQANGGGWLAALGWPLNSWLLAAALGAMVGVVVVVLRHRYEKQRQASLLEVSNHLGFEFHATPIDLDLPAMQVFEDRVGLKNHLRGVDQDVVYDVFDLSTMSKSSDSNGVMRQTVVLTTVPGLPEFRLTGMVGLGRVYGWIVQGVTFNPMAFEDSNQRAIVERFNKAYVLVVDDAGLLTPSQPAKSSSAEPGPTDLETREAAVRDWFRVGLLEALASYPGWRMESKGGYLALWRGSQEWSGAQLVAHVAQAVALRSEFSKGAGSGPLVPAEPEGVRRRKVVLRAAQVLGSVCGMLGGFFIGGGVSASFFFQQRAGQGLPEAMFCAPVGSLTGLVLGVAIGTGVGRLTPAMPPQVGRSLDWRVGCLIVCGFFGGFLGGAVLGVVAGEAFAKGDTALTSMLFFGGAGLGILLLPMTMFMLAMWVFAERVPKPSNANDIK